MVGRAFSVITPFGCGPLPQAAIPDATGDVTPAGLASAAWGPERKTLRLTLTPADWIDSPLLGEPQTDGGWEAVEGFWLTRPWLATSDCPAVAPAQTTALAADAAVQTVGLAAVFAQDASRLARRNGRAYSFTVRPASEGGILVWPAQGYRLVVEGRITAFPDGRAFRCRATNPDQRPVCIAAMSLDRVAFTAANGDVLSEWRPG